MIRSYLLFMTFMVCTIHAQTKTYQIKNLKINTEYPHFGLMPINNSKIIFTSYLLDKKGRPKLAKGAPKFAAYEGNVAGEAITSIKRIPIDDKQNIPFITSAAYSPNGKKLYIATAYTGKNRPKGNYDPTNFYIAVGEFKPEVGWTNFKALPFCNPRYSYAHPTFSKDGKVLYFTADIRGGKETTKGGSDIFKVNVLEDGTYGPPKNLGSQVNSYSRDMFPFISADNTLYFASNRPRGFGGFDIYKSTMSSDGTFAKAEILGEPFNSNKDDFSFIMISKNSGYLSSKRYGGKGDDDIYYFSF